MPTAEDFADWVAICEVKARYCRFLDTKQWEAWTELFTEDLVLDTSEAGGGMTVGRDAAVREVRGFLEGSTTAHQVHTPEIVIRGDTAEAIWAMQDRVLFANGTGIVGYGHYREDYVRQDDGWRIARSKLTRLHVDAAAPSG